VQSDEPVQSDETAAGVRTLNLSNCCAIMIVTTLKIFTRYCQLDGARGVLFMTSFGFGVFKLIEKKAMEFL